MTEQRLGILGGMGRPPGLRRAGTPMISSARGK